MTERQSRMQQGVEEDDIRRGHGDDDLAGTGHRLGKARREQH
ncbi:hypothetical protein [Streptosporangium pseudovulgare]|nr:hypothetical protein [Streptosporangium pseudovulgare]